LGHVQGRARENVSDLSAGSDRHAWHGRSLAVSAFLQKVGVILVLAALAAAALLALSGGLR